MNDSQNVNGQMQAVWTEKPNYMKQMHSYSTAVSQDA